MRKLLTCVISIILVMILYACAFADIIYMTDTGDIGRIIVKSESTDLSGIEYDGTDSDSFLGSYWDGSTSRVILVDRTTDTTSSGDTALIFNPSNLSAPVNSEPKVLAGIYNAQAMASTNSGRGVFFASGASIYEFNTGDFSVTRSYTYTPKTSEDIAPNFKALLSGSSNVYALGEKENSGDVMLRFDGQLRDDVSKNFGLYSAPSGATDIAWLNNSVPAVAHDTGVSVWRSSKFVQMVSSDYPVKAVCLDTGSGFYFAEQSESGDTYTTTLKHYASGSDTTTLRTETGGSACKLIYDSDNGLLAALIGSKILIYSMHDDTLIDEYDSESLEGQPINIIMSYVKGDDGKSSSGCDISGAGMIILLAGALIFRKR